MRRLPWMCLLLLALSLPCFGEDLAHLGLPYFSLEVPAGFAKRKGPTVSGGTLKTTAWVWRPEGAKPLTLAASLSTFSGTVPEEYDRWMTRLRSPQQPGFEVSHVTGEKLPGDMRLIRYWWSYKGKWDYRVDILAAPGRSLGLAAWSEGSRKSPEVKSLVDGVAATVKYLK